MRSFWMVLLLSSLVSATGNIESIAVNTTAIPCPTDNSTLIPAGGDRSPGFTRTYRKLVTDANPDNFFDHFKFFTAPDPTKGHVRYVAHQEAADQKLLRRTSDAVIIRVDWRYPAPNGRLSVRLESKQLYTGGLFILDVDHIPWGCGVWPAWWTFGAQGIDWPKAGEIDIIEGINNQTHNSMVVHTETADCVCKIKDSPTLQTGITEKDKTCNPKEPNQYIKVHDHRRNTFGPDFMGGVFAMEWTDKAIKMWFFPRGKEPKDLKGKPTPGNWGKPAYHINMKQCWMKKRFQKHRVIINTTLCGHWAGIQSIWEKSQCAKTTGKSTCVEHVHNDPTAFSKAYWKIRSMKVWQQ